MPVVPDSISAAVEELGQVQESTRVVGRKHSYSQATNGSQTSELEHQQTQAHRNHSGASSATRTSSASMKTTLEAITEFEEDLQFIGHTAVSTDTNASLDSQQYEKVTAFALMVHTIDSDNSNNVLDDSDNMEIIIAPKVKPG